MEWVISDTHFGHAKIIEYCNRPFKDADHMNRAIVMKWQNRVKPEDIIYHLGDVGLTREDFLTKIVAELPGYKILILGNHDKSAKRMREFGFDIACDSMLMKPDGYHGKVFLNHRPLLALPKDADYVLHGHIHNSTVEDRMKFKREGELAHIPDFNINLSVEMTNYEPVPLVWAIKKHIGTQRMKGFA